MGHSAAATKGFRIVPAWTWFVIAFVAWAATVVPTTDDSAPRADVIDASQRVAYDVFRELLAPLSREGLEDSVIRDAGPLYQELFELVSVDLYRDPAQLLRAGLPDIRERVDELAGAARITLFTELHELFSPDLWRERVARLRRVTEGLAAAPELAASPAAESWLRLGLCLSADLRRLGLLDFQHLAHGLEKTVCAALSRRLTDPERLAREGASWLNRLRACATDPPAAAVARHEATVSEAFVFAAVGAAPFAAAVEQAMLRLPHLRHRDLTPELDALSNYEDRLVTALLDEREGADEYAHWREGLLGTPVTSLLVADLTQLPTAASLSLRSFVDHLERALHRR